MKKNVLLFALGLVILLSFSSCVFSSAIGEKPENAKKEMRDFVIKISEKAREVNPGFEVIPQNGQPVAWDDDENPELDEEYISAISGTGREDTFYGTDSKWGLADGNATPAKISQEYMDYCDAYKNAGITVLSVDYTTGNSEKIKDSFEKNNKKGYISFAATERNLNAIPSYKPYGENSDSISSLKDAKSFLYLINPEDYADSTEFVNSLAQTNYDVLIIDLFCNEEMLTKQDISLLKKKANGGSRLVICYMSIGEAEDYRWYWKKEWKRNKPDFLCAENPDWDGNYKVRYWKEDWQKIICGDEDSYLGKILDVGFDGVYLDIIDAYEYFE